MNTWPFADPEIVAAITMRQIVYDKHPVLLVLHDEEDGGWQFLTGSAFNVADGLVVALKNVVALDSSLLELADLPIGWEASRASGEKPWVREKSAG
jgi:hypothetical protein